MKYFIHIFTFLTALLVLGACSQDETTGGQLSGEYLSLSLDIVGMDGQAATRVTVPEVNGEGTIDGNLYLFFFESTSDQSGQLVDCIVLTQPEASITTPISTAGTAVSASVAYNVVGVANISSYLSSTDYAAWVDSWSGRTEAYFKNNVVANLISTDDAYTNLESAKLPMYGTSTKAASSGSINLSLTRAVARFDVTVTAADYTLVSAQLANVYTRASISGQQTLDYGKDNTAMRTGIFAEAVTPDATTPNEIKGRLYAFENQSSAPAYGDKVTTCLLVGLVKDENTTYHRININPADAAQVIKRNSVYSVTIISDVFDGYATIDEAYESTDDRLNYTINNWDLGENGLIVSDSYSILSVPVKTIQMGRDAGESLSYTITTFSTLSNPTPLAIAAQDDANGAFTISRYGDLLTVVANTSLSEGDADLTGSVTLTYAGLQATIAIVQSYNADLFLTLAYETGWSTMLNADVDDISKTVYVNASGSWKAEIVGDGGLAFDTGVSGEYPTEITSATWGSNNFKLRTSSTNPSKVNARKGFVVVSLNDDPINYAAVVSMSQSAKGDLTVDPLVTTIIFDGAGTMISPTGVDEFTFSTTTGNFTNLELSGTHSDFFRVSGDEVGGTTATKSFYANGINASAGDYTATFTATNSQGASYTINIIQKPLSLVVVAASPITVDAVGGVTGDIYLSSTEIGPLPYTATFTVEGLERSIYNHAVKLDTSTGTTIVEGRSISLDAGETFGLNYPKIYFPNRETTIRATVTLTTNAGGSISRVFTQNKLASNGVHIWSSYYSAWGAISYNTAGVSNGAYFTPFSDYLKTHVLNGIASGQSSVTNAASLSSANSVAVSGSNTTWAHVSNNGLSATQTWTAVQDFMDNVDGVTVFMSDDYNVAPRNSLANNSPLASLGYEFTNPGVIAQAAGNSTKLVTTDVVKRTLVYQFLMEQGKQTIPSSYWDSFTLYNDGVNTGVLTTSELPSTAIPILQYTNGSYAMIIDPANGTVYHGDCTNFYYTVNTSNYRQQFMSNYQDYLAFAAMYGSHFTDLLRDDLGLFPPWSPVWETNAWPERSY